MFLVYLSAGADLVILQLWCWSISRYDKSSGRVRFNNQFVIPEPFHSLSLAAGIHRNCVLRLILSISEWKNRKSNITHITPAQSVISSNTSQKYVTWTCLQHLLAALLSPGRWPLCPQELDASGRDSPEARRSAVQGTYLAARRETDGRTDGGYIVFFFFWVTEVQSEDGSMMIDACFGGDCAAGPHQ